VEGRRFDISLRHGSEDGGRPLRNHRWEAAGFPKKKMRKRARHPAGEEGRLAG
jgi:hypothetical protein